jgi:hypothetical protein
MRASETKVRRNYFKNYGGYLHSARNNETIKIYSNLKKLISFLITINN